jgi:hypothetical protein
MSDTTTPPVVRFDDATLRSMCGAALRCANELQAPGTAGGLNDRAAATIRRLVTHLERERTFANQFAAPPQAPGPVDPPRPNKPRDVA